MKTKKTMAEKFLAKGWRLASQTLPKYGDTIIVAKFLKTASGYHFVDYCIDVVSRWNSDIMGNEEEVACFTNPAILFWKPIQLPTPMFNRIDASISDLIKKGGEL